MVYRCIAPDWLLDETSGLRRAVDGEFTEEQLLSYNEQGYNVYYFPNYPKLYEGGSVQGYQVDTFEYVFADMDLKDEVYASKEAFLEIVSEFPLIPTKIVDSGNGIHVYWAVTDLDAKSFLRLQRRISRMWNTDPMVSLLSQLMRLPGYVNTKKKDDYKLCQILFESDNKYRSEDLDSALPLLTPDDEAYCNTHYDNTHNSKAKSSNIQDKLPLKFAKLLESSPEVKAIWSQATDDRSGADFRLGHIMFASGFSKEEATSVLVNCAKALSRAPIHRLGYAENIVNKIWTYEIEVDKNALNLSSSVTDILKKSGNDLKGTRFPCYSYFDNTVHGFRIGQVIGLVAGVGVGKTAVALNMFMGFVQNNPDYDHFFVPLEQPKEEIADRWKTMCGTNEHLHDKVQVLSNYDDAGTYRNLSLLSIQEYIIKYQEVTGRKVGCVVIDHIGILKKSSKEGRQSIEDICHTMKAFAIATQTLLVMQSQAPREKASIGDIELDKDAAYGTVFFESYCDYLITMWQPLKRVYPDGAPTITALKFCKIRHKKTGKDEIKEDLCYKLRFDSETEHLRPLNADEELSFDYFLNQALNKRKRDKKTDLVQYVSIKPEEIDDGRKANSIEG